jgi:hypothetical protein
MIVTKEIDVIVRVTLKIDTDKIGYGIHGGIDSDETEEIANKAISHFVENYEPAYSACIEDGIYVVESGVITYNKN